MTSPRSAAAASSQFCAAQARSSGTLAGLLSVGPGAEADSRYIALPAVRRSSMTRRALKALARVNAAVIGTSPPQRT